MNTILVNDARNRALRSFLVGLSIDVAVGIVLVLLVTFKTANGWGDIEWTILSFSVAKSFVQSAGSYILRRFLDPSDLPTPLPPADPGEPDAEDQDGLFEGDDLDPDRLL